MAAHSFVAKLGRLRHKTPSPTRRPRAGFQGHAMPLPPHIRLAPLPALRPRQRALAAFALLSVLISAPALAQSDPVVARVNGVEVRQSDLTLAEEDLGQNMQHLTGSARRDFLIGYVADVILAAKAAEAKKVAEQKEFKSRLAFIRNKLLMEMLLNDEGKAAATDQAMRRAYDEAVSEMSSEQEVRARHILVATEAEAKAILAEVQKGTDFAELARQKSKDPGAAAEGGDLGYFAKDQMVPEFSEAAFKLEKGQLSEPVKTQFGWHIIKVEDKRKKPAPSYDSVKDQVEAFVIRRAQAAYIAKLREGAKIDRLDK
jgi:peptidyl-prolyl cis-trans isomerase C